MSRGLLAFLRGDSLREHRETPQEREDRAQDEWEQTSQDPVAKRHREWQGRSEVELLEAMAVKEEAGERWCRLARAESDLAYKLYSQGLIAETRSYNVTELRDKGRRVAREARIERGENPDPVTCEECGHGFLSHRGLYPSFSEEDRREGEQEDAWKSNNHCHRCPCPRFVFPASLPTEGAE